MPSGTVTFLFTDVEGSTRRWQDEPEAMRALLVEHDAILREVIDKHRGHLFKHTGDGIAAVFSSATDAVLAAVDAQARLVEVLPVRMGLHTGEAELRDGDYFGSTLNRCARIMSIAHGGQVVLSAAVAGLVREQVDLVDLGEHRLRDLSYREQVSQVVAPGLAASFPRLRSLDASLGNLPLQHSSFLGRDQEVAAVAAVLGGARLVTLVGAGGVGKTRLAVHVAAEVSVAYPDGVWLCELGAAGDGDDMLQVVAAALGVRPGAEGSFVDSVVAFLQYKRLLLVLDNCEHVLDPAGQLCERILERCPNVKVLATSREALAVDGEHVWPLRSLGVPIEDADTEAIVMCDAVRLFAERAQAARPDFVIDAGNGKAVGEICRRLDGIPLALELAAARVTAMRPAEIAGLLDARFRLLTTGRRGAASRHQTLRAAVEWSCSLLNDRDRMVFERLAVFTGTFSVSSAVAVTAGDDFEAWDVIDALSGLVGKSMVVDQEAPDGTTRYMLLETMREYARERLVERGEVNVWRRRHAGHYADVAEEIGRALLGPDELVWRRGLRADLDNLRAAVTWGLDADTDNDAEFAMRIVGALAYQAMIHSGAGVAAWGDRALAKADASPRRALVYAAAAWSAWVRGEFDATRTRALEALRSEPPPDAATLACIALIINAAQAGDHLEAKRVLVETDSVARPTGGVPINEVYLHGAASYAASLKGDTSTARDEAAVSLFIARELHNPSAIALQLFALAVAIIEDEPDRALQLLDECAALSRAGAADTVFGQVLALLALGRLATDPMGALRALREAVLYDHHGGLRTELVMVFDRGLRILSRIGHPGIAAVLAGAVTGPFQTMSTIPANEVHDQRAAIDEIRTALGPDEYQRATSRGAAMSYEDLVDYALTELDRLLAFG